MYLRVELWGPCALCALRMLPSQELKKSAGKLPTPESTKDPTVVKHANNKWCEPNTNKVAALCWAALSKSKTYLWPTTLPGKTKRQGLQSPVGLGMFLISPPGDLRSSPLRSACSLRYLSEIRPVNNRNGGLLGHQFPAVSSSCLPSGPIQLPLDVSSLGHFTHFI